MEEPTNDFVPTMVSFLAWYFRTLDPTFVEKVLDGRSIEVAASELFASVAAEVRGNRHEDASLTAGDYGRMMDRIATLHLQTRYGEDAVRID